MIDVTTIDRLRAWTDEQQLTAYSTLLSQMITGFSYALENEMGRYLSSEARTTYIDVFPGDYVFFLKGYPVTAAPSFYEDSARLFTGSAIASTDFDNTQSALNSGRFAFDYHPSEGSSALKCTYTGGMASTTAALISGYPDLASAAERQLWFWYTHKGMVGLDGEGGGQLSGSARKEVQVMTWWQAHGGLLPEVHNAIQKYKSYVIRW